MTESKRRAINRINEKVDFLHSVENYYDLEEKYNYVLMVEDSLCVPYASKQIVRKNEKVRLTEYVNSRKNSIHSKSIITLGLKAAYDITDKEIEMLCDEFNLDEDDFYTSIQILRNTLALRKTNKESLISIRNRAYHYHIQYSEAVGEDTLSTEWIKQAYQTKYNIHTRRWKFLNNDILNGRFHLCPSNNSIAKVLGISTRQVSYYIKRFQQDLSEIRRNKIETFKN